MSMSMSMSEYASRACQFIIDEILYKCRKSTFNDFPKCDYIGKELHSFLIDSSEFSDYFYEFFCRFIAVEKKIGGKCFIVTHRRELPESDDNADIDFDDNDEYDRNDSYLIDTDDDIDIDPRVRYFPLKNVLYWPEIHSALRRELEPRGYTTFVIRTNDENFRYEHIKIIIIKKP